MGHTWIEKPKIIVPTFEKYNIVGNAIQSMPDSIFLFI